MFLVLQTISSYTVEILSLLLALEVAHELDRLSHPQTFVVGHAQPDYRTKEYKFFTYLLPLFWALIYASLKVLSMFISFSHLELMHYIGLIVVSVVFLEYTAILYFTILFAGPKTSMNPALDVETYRKRMILFSTLLPVLAFLILIVYTNLAYKINPVFWAATAITAA